MTDEAPEIELEELLALLGELAGDFGPGGPHGKGGTAFYPAKGLHRVELCPRGGGDDLVLRRQAVIEALAAPDEEVCWLIQRYATSATFGEGTTERVLRFVDPDRKHPLEWRVVQGRLGAFDLRFASKIVPGRRSIWLTVPARGIGAHLGARRIPIFGPPSEAPALDALAAAPPEPPSDWRPTERLLASSPALPIAEREAWAASAGRPAPDLVWVDLSGHGTGELWFVADRPVRVARASSYRRDDYSGAETFGFAAELLALPGGEWLVRLEHTHAIDYGGSTSRHQRFVSEGGGARFVAHEGPEPEGPTRVGRLVRS